MYVTEPMLLKTRFEDCKFTGSMHKWVTRSTSFVRCEFAGEITDSALQTLEAGTDISHNDFRNTSLVDLTFRGGVSLREQALPLADGNLDVLKTSEGRVQAVLNQVVAEGRSNKLVAALRTALFEVQTGQVELLIARDSLPTDVVDALSIDP